MPAPLILVTSPQLSDEAKRMLAAAGAQVGYMAAPSVPEETLIEELNAKRYAGVLMRGSPPFTRRVLAAAPALKIIAKHGAGVDSVDMVAATELGIAVMNAGGANADSVAEHAIALMLSLARELPGMDRGMRGGLWKKGTYVGREFRGRVVGVVGYGEIGRRVAHLAQQLGARPLLYSRSGFTGPAGTEVETDFDALLTRSDILSLHCPLTERTRGLIGARELALLPPGAILINTARGGVVDEQALIAALESGKLAAAGLDTFAAEPPDPKNPLFQLPNVICTPHVAAMTEGAMLRMGTIAAQNLIGYLAGGSFERANLLNPAVLEH